MKTPMSWVIKPVTDPDSNKVESNVKSFRIRFILWFSFYLLIAVVPGMIYGASGFLIGLFISSLLVIADGLLQIR